MNNIYLTDAKYDVIRDWVRRRREKNRTWNDLYYAQKNDDDGLAEFLKSRVDEEDWPQLSVDEWHDLIKSMEEVDNKSQAMLISSRVGELHSGFENNEISVPRDPNSSWQLYKKHIINDNGFSVDAANNLEDSCIAILRRMSSNTVESGPIKGLVIGNVQSGKTANMAGLMAMAADWGWNVFVVMSGTIESLRKQTQTRLYNDLNHPGNLTWISFEHLSKKAPAGNRASDLNLLPLSPQRYLTVVLKVKSRLQNLIEWIENDRNNIKNMKVLVIDDEADQASINTADVYTNEERKTINRLILNLVHCRNYKAKGDEDNKYNSFYRAMNYISYTATPYANCLNEIGDDTLYPKSFMRTLPLSPEYFGPKQIFGLKDIDVQTLDIVREIEESEEEYIKNHIHNGETNKIPQTLNKALLWFICASAVMRYYQYKKPVSMLVHTSQKQQHHHYVAEAIENWFFINKDLIPSQCRNLYKTEISRLTKANLFRIYKEYAVPSDEVWDMPPFEKLENIIKELVSDMTPIMLDDEGELTYSRHIHLCIDNCKNTGINDGMHMRLAYPDENSENCPDFATAFIVIGGNTLSRGLTINGLVSTYFLRTVNQADTLMQMGRWFGYRKHYELLPRIWMTDDAKNKFEFLADIDFDLRDQIYQMGIQGKTPADFRPAIINSPKLRWMRLTSKKKMQMAMNASYSGMDTQLTVYSKDPEVLKQNIRSTENLLSKIGKPREAYKNNAYVWDNIPFSTIKKEFFDTGFTVPKTSIAFQEIDALTEWVEKLTQQDRLTNWNVVVVGNVIKSNTPDNEIWTLPGGEQIGKVHRSASKDYGDRLNIGVLSSKKDYIADIQQDQLDSNLWKGINSRINDRYREYREIAGMSQVPVFIIYRISKDSKASESSNSGRKALEVSDDLIGITLLTPSVAAEGAKQRVQIADSTKKTERGN